MHKVGTVRHARNAEKIGCDAVIAVGFEGAGHPMPDDVTHWNLIPRMSDAVKIPVIAAGGTTEGRQLLAALSLGAEAVVLGTVFVATKESAAHPNFKQALVDASEYDTIIIQKTIENQTRVLKNKAALEVAEMEARKATLEELLTVISGERGKRAMMGGEIEVGTMTVGQGVGLIKSIPTVQQVMDNLVNGAEATLKSLNGRLKA